jgi:hypothetical protein
MVENKRFVKNFLKQGMSISAIHARVQSVIIVPANASMQAKAFSIMCFKSGF